MALTDFLQQKLKHMAENDRHRSLKTTHRDFSEQAYVTRNGKKLTSFCCNDFLGLSHHPDVIEATVKAVQEYGVGAGASRLITGSHPFYKILEKELAQYKAMPEALVFGSGYLTNIGCIPALVGKEDLVIVDRLAHACILDGIKLSGAKFYRYRNNDVQHCQQLLEKHRKHYRHCLVITEHVFSMDGTVAPLQALQKLATEYESLLYVDDAHGLATVTDQGNVKPDIYMGTLSKVLGSYGGYVCSNTTIIDYLIHTARSLIFSTGLPVTTIAAAIAALNVIKSQTELTQRPLEKARYFCKLLDLPPPQSPIVPLILGDDNKALTAAHALEEKGYLVSAIRPPTVPENTARLRFTFTALHENRDIEDLASYIQKQKWGLV
jgi:8-amino-7-oxononanoate synthase